MRILLTGARGQVGTEFQKLDLAGTEILAPSREEFDLSNIPLLRSYISTRRPDVIVNAGAYTAVDLAEKERDLCFTVNAAAPAAIAEEAARLGSMLIHFSTDYVFDGTKPGPYTETDPTRPLGVYGASKAEGEQAILSTGARALILRTSWVYSLHGKNFLLTMLRLAHERPELRVVSDQIGAPTSARAIAGAALRLIHQNRESSSFPTGIYHMTAAGSTSWHGFAQAIVQQAGLETPPQVTPITTDQFPTPAQRPKNSVLSNDKFAAAFGFRLPPWEQELKVVPATR